MLLYKELKYFLLSVKIQDFFVIQILSEINFEESRSYKPAIFTILGALISANMVNFTLQKEQKFQNIKI